jgi:hypothetical protein
MNFNNEITKNPTILVSTSFNVQELTILELKIGDKATLIPKENIQRLYSHTYPYETLHKGNAIYKVVSGEEIEISEEEHYELIVKTSGWVSYHNGIGFEIENGTIVSASLYNFFEVLEIKHCKDISEKFGEPDEIERSSSGRTFYYFEKQLQIYWGGSQPDEYEKYSRIKIGKLNKQETFYTAKDILQQYLKLSHWERSILQRTNIDKVTEPYYYYRFANLVALLKAFGLTATKNKFTEKNRSNTTVVIIDETEHLSLQEHIDQKVLSPILYFQEGYFLAHRPLQAYTLTLEQMINYAKSRKEESINRSDFDVFFRWLLRYRKHAQVNLDELSGVLEASGVGCFFAAELISDTNTVFAKELQKIEELLCDMIDPENRAISQKELVKNFGYLEVDLRDIDLELDWNGTVSSWLVD